MPSDYDIAKRRGERAAKLFKQKSFMDDIIAALKKEDAHNADPTNPEKPSGMGDFFAACSQAIKKADDAGIPADDDVKKFFNDLWNATCESRRAHEAKPCW